MKLCIFVLLLLVIGVALASPEPASVTIHPQTGLRHIVTFTPTPGLKREQIPTLEVVLHGLDISIDSLESKIGRSPDPNIPHWSFEKYTQV